MHGSEANFDGLVGPTHNYAGLSLGNVASMSHAEDRSNPREAALQGLEKMRILNTWGLHQGILAPHERPFVKGLREIGFSGNNDSDVIEKAFRYSPHLLAQYCSASPMWTANAATISPSCDSKDGKVHITPANLSEKLHRSIESSLTSRILKATFSDESHFVHHPPLHSHAFFGDEGAANHTRLCGDYAKPGLQIFTYGRHASRLDEPSPKKFPARQTLEASQAIVRLHQLEESQRVFCQQLPETIDCGVFHNDVISVGNQNVFLFHEKAFYRQDQVIDEIRKKFEAMCPEIDLHLLMVPESAVSVSEAVSTYLFNTQLVRSSNSDHPGSMTLVAPKECEESKSVSAYLESLVSQDNPISKVEFFDLRQSMKNGGGPACLRLRVAMTESELQGVNSSCLIGEDSYKMLTDWVQRHYRDRLALSDLADPKLLIEVREALDELTQILRLGSIYDFQRQSG